MMFDTTPQTEGAPTSPSPWVEQAVRFGRLDMEATSPAQTPYYHAGRKMYAIGAVSGDFPALGEHIRGEMAGLWAHPIKVLDGFFFEINENGHSWRLVGPQKFIHGLAHVEFLFEKEGLLVQRRDFIVEGEPALFSLLRVQNTRQSAVDASLSFTSQVNIMPSWSSGWGNGPEEVVYQDGRVVAYDQAHRGKWAVVFGTEAPAARYQAQDRAGKKAVTLAYLLHLEAGQEVNLSFLIVAEHEAGPKKALASFDALIAHGPELLAEKVGGYQERIYGGAQFECSDPAFTRAFYLAKANLVMLTADISPYLGEYFFAGIPEYPQLFGCDNEYSVPGIAAAGFTQPMRSTLEALARIAAGQGGRVPHEVATNGRVYNPGNTQETPQFAIAVWSYFQWTGDAAFLEATYPLCVRGIFDFVLKQFDDDNDLYPQGNAMVERTGMGPEKLDSTCYLYQALVCLGQMAEVLGKREDGARYVALAGDLKARFNRDWWSGSESVFADSLREDHSRQLDGHWTVAVPMETGIAHEDKGLRSLRRIEKDWLSSWGLVHTREQDQRVWTLPTGVLALAEFRYGNPEMGVRLLGNIAETVNHGMLGAYKELIPEGLCFMQLWSPALFLQGVVQGVFGLEPRAGDDWLGISPQLPAGWDYARLEDLAFGEHRASIRCDDDRLTIVHSPSASPLT
ncbi:MAG: amylo-alpha-1,6-glucosidase, partial [Chloroflexi bacterium]|nr:amylo-alpha-1,6-glucosidase [Chloroflexota bacterium]